MQTELLKEQNNYMTGSDSFLRAHQDALSGQRADLSVMLQTPKNSHAVNPKLDQRFDVLVVDLWWFLASGAIRWQKLTSMGQYSSQAVI